MINKNTYKIKLLQLVLLSTIFSAHHPMNKHKILPVGYFIWECQIVNAQNFRIGFGFLQKSTKKAD